jgi:hypothetical protein
MLNTITNLEFGKQAINNNDPAQLYNNDNIIILLSFYFFTILITNKLTNHARKKQEGITPLPLCKR